MDDAVGSMTYEAGVFAQIAERMKMGAKGFGTLALGLILGLLESVALAGADPAESAATTVERQGTAPAADDAAGNADLIGTWVLQPSAKKKQMSIRSGPRDPGRIDC